MINKAIVEKVIKVNGLQIVVITVYLYVIKVYKVQNLIFRIGIEDLLLI